MPEGQVCTDFGKWWSFKPDLSVPSCPVPDSLRSCREREQDAAFEGVITEPRSAEAVVLGRIYTLLLEGKGTRQKNSGLDLSARVVIALGISSKGLAH